jgi:hypothetical protein
LGVNTDPVWCRIVYGIITEDENGSRTPSNWLKAFGSRGNGNGQFKNPKGICIDTTDYGYSNIYYIYVADCGNNRIVKLEYNSSSETISWEENITTSPVGSFSSSTDVACVTDSTGRAWVVIADAGNNRIVYFKDVNGQRTWYSYGSSGSGQGQFKNPISVDIQNISPSGLYFIYVADNGNKRLVRLWLNPLPTPVVTWLGQANTQAYFSAVATTNFYGDVYGVEQYTGKVYHYGFGLFPLLENQGSLGCDSGQFLWPRDISICDGECGITEEWTNLTGIQYFWLDTEIKDAYASPDTFDPSSIQSSGAGTWIYYTLTGGARVCSLYVYRNFIQSNTLVKRIARNQQLAGENWANWDGTNDGDSLVPWGDYKVVIKAIDPYGDSLQRDENYVIKSIDTVDVVVSYCITANFSAMTAYNTGWKIGGPLSSVVPDKQGKWFEVAHTQWDSVYSETYDLDSYRWRGQTWLSIGRFPALAVDFDDSIGGHIAWLDVSRTSIWYRHDRFTYQLFPSFSGSYYFSPPSIAVGKDYWGEPPFQDSVFIACEYLRQPNNPNNFGIIYWRFPVGNPGNASFDTVQTWQRTTNFGPIDTLGVALSVWPNVVVPVSDSGMTPYFIWENGGDIWAAQGDWLAVNLSDTFNIPYPCRRPSGEIYGAFFGVVAVMKAPGGDVLIRWSPAPGPFPDPPSLRDLVKVDTVYRSYNNGTIDWPTIRKGISVMWQEKRPTWTNWEVYNRLWNVVTQGWWDEGALSGSAFGDACYPHSEIWHPGENQTTRFAVWTEKVNSSQYLLAQNLKTFGYSEGFKALARSQSLPDDSLFLIPTIYITGGGEPEVIYLTGKGTSHYYAVDRDTFRVFNNGPSGRVDIGEDSLVYSLALRPNSNYRLMLEIYAEGNGEWRYLFDVDGTVSDTISFQPGEVKRVLLDIPQAACADSSVVLKLSRITGDYVACARLIVWEFGEASPRTMRGLNGVSVLPRIFALYQNFPNPFRQVTTIKYQVPVETQISLKIYDVMGRLVRKLVNEKQKPGYYTVHWDGKADNGQRLASGVYFYRFETKDFKSTKKIVQVR